MLPLPHKTIDFAALRHNWRVIRRQSTAKRLLAVIKSNAYGHGLLSVAQTLADSADGFAPDGFAVVRLEDAIALRDGGLDKKIVLLQGVFSAAEMAAVVEYRLSPVVHSAWQLTALTTLPARTGLTVFLKINTGMNRLGFELSEAPAAIEALNNIAAVRQVVLMTHFANADREGGLVAPLNRFAPLRATGLPVSLGNSGGCLLHGDIGDDWGRIGIALYGASPAPLWRPRSALDLLPVMHLTTRLIAVRQLKRGEQLGYGGMFTAPESMPVGIAAGGYGDGYPRRSGLPAAINGQRTTVIGQVSMEMLSLDLRPHPQAAVGDEVTLWGHLPEVDEVATAAETIAYDLLTAA